MLVGVLAPFSWFLVRDLAPMMEVIAIVLPVAGAAAGALAVVLGWRRRVVGAATLASVALVCAVATAGPRLAAPSGLPAGETISFVTANLATANPDADDLVRGLAAGYPDVFVTVETSDTALLALGQVLDRFPYVVEGEPGVRSRVVVYSRFPLRRLPTLDSMGEAQVVVVEVEPEMGPITLYAAHLPRPWFSGSDSGHYQATLGEQQRIVDELAAAVAATEGPTVVAGDLNLTDRGRGYRTLLADGGLTDVVRQRPAGSTSLKWWPFALRIDHVLTRNGMCGSDPARLTLPGSDHRGLWVNLGPCSDRGSG